MGMSQKELAERLNYADHSAIAHIERGRIDLPQSKIVAIAKALNTTPGDLMGDVEPYPVSDEVEELADRLKYATTEQLQAIFQLLDVMGL